MESFRGRPGHWITHHANNSAISGRVGEQRDDKTTFYTPLLVSVCMSSNGSHVDDPEAVLYMGWYSDTAASIRYYVHLETKQLSISFQKTIFSYHSWPHQLTDATVIQGTIKIKIMCKLTDNNGIKDHPSWWCDRIEGEGGVEASRKRLSFFLGKIKNSRDRINTITALAEIWVELFYFILTIFCCWCGNSLVLWGSDGLLISS